MDESGDLAFNAKGSRYYLFTAAWTYDPGPLARDLTALRFKLLKSGHLKPKPGIGLDGQDLGCFHACEDPLPRRNAVLDVLTNHTGWSFASIVIDKPLVNPTIRAAAIFYPKFAASILKFVIRGRMRNSTTQVMVYTDTLPLTGPQRDAVELTIKATCTVELRIPFQSLHHRRESNAWIQVADYCSWSVFRKWVSADASAYDRLRPRLAAQELNALAGGGTTYY